VSANDKNAINFAELEENCNKIKKVNDETQTNCYLKYKNDLGEIILQYFRDNYNMEKKMSKISKDGYIIIKHSVKKSRKKVEKVDKSEKNIKIQTIFN